MSDRETFVLTNEHLDLLRAAQVSWEDCEFGAPAIDCKRPYGNSDVIGDIHELLGGSGESTVEDEQRYRLLHAETKTALQIMIQTASIRPGTYVSEKYYNDWSFVSGAEGVSPSTASGGSDV